MGYSYSQNYISLCVHICMHRYWTHTLIQLYIHIWNIQQYIWYIWIDVQLHVECIVGYVKFIPWNSVPGTKACPIFRQFKYILFNGHRISMKYFHCTNKEMEEAHQGQVIVPGSHNDSVAGLGSNPCLFNSGVQLFAFHLSSCLTWQLTERDSFQN